MKKKKRKIIRKTYRTYLNEFKKVARKLAKKGYEPYEQPYSRSEWYNTLSNERLTRTQLIKMGKRKTIGNITRDIVSQQVYARSGDFGRNAVKALNKFYKEHDIKDDSGKIKKMTLTQARFADEKDFEGIKEYYHQLTDGGMKGKEAGEMIAGEFFGS